LPQLELRLSLWQQPETGSRQSSVSNLEEDFSDKAAGVQIMPWRLEPELKERGANYISAGLFKPFAIRDGRLVTGQRQYSGRKVAQMVIEMLGI
jgi:putative intracellular protease/amidase